MRGIVLTDEMVQAFSLVFFRDPLGADVRAGLRAVLDIVDREHGPHCDEGFTDLLVSLERRDRALADARDEIRRLRLRLADSH